MNKVWSSLIIVGIVFTIFFGDLNNLGDVIVSSTTDAFNIFFKLALLILFWNGIFKIAIDSGLIKNVTKILVKPLSYIFPEVDKKSICMEYICSNIIANILGLGAAATPLGLKAFEELQKLNKNKEIPSRSMSTFVLLNVSSLTFFPTTIISLRSLSGGSTDGSLICLMILTTCFATMFVIVLDRIIYLVKRRGQR